jgi:MoaA/NifB/PqqE/SkfB family radical SAM enzyme
MPEKIYIKILPQISKVKIKNFSRRLAERLSKRILTYLQKREKKIILKINITNRSGLGVGNNEIKDFPIDIFKKLLKEVKKYGFSTAAFIGEAILHPQFTDFVSLTCQENYQLSLMIEDPFLYWRYWEVIKENRENCSSINLVLAGANAKVHEKILKQKKGSFEKIIEAINFFIEKRIPVNLIVYLNKKSQKQFKDIALLAYSQKIRNLRYTFSLKASGEEKYTLSDKEREICLKKIKEFIQTKDFSQPRIFVSPHLLIDNYKDICFCKNLSPFRQLYVDYDGGIIFCGGLSQYKRKPNLFKNEVSDCLNENISIISEFHKQRLEDLRKERHFNGLTTCDYCNKNIDGIIKKLKK